MAIAKAERLMNLALCLMNTRRPVSKRELRESIEAYHEIGSDDAFNRMFERDKDDLRELGLIIETVESVDGDVGYLARRDRNRLPEIALDAEEAAALSLAAKVWQQARLAEAASGALQKLRAAGVPFEDTHSALEPRIPTPEPAFEPLMVATRERRAVSFDYRKANAVRPEPRQVEPWALECWRGHWYLAGWDRDRGAVRVFRLSRISGKVRSRGGAFSAPVPDHVDVRAAVASWAGEGATATARIRLRRDSGYPLRSKAVTSEPVDAEWDELEIPYGHGLDAWLVEFGPDVVVLEPAELRADVVDRLRAVAKD
ncbi:WYL domain-containing protein [Streptomyces sp. SID13666]|uniref:helix-turn-helix transcriptional regulator n=1 Tax=unclassified Streptomyces TaxID=2593676 RepID=UPI0013C0D4CD|nr:MULTISPECIES: WYL domain-containing protein [unclassified Streptomyces]NEA55756.1 WYL domain-containing protein [Streptomyces sp. SID13666]NEA71222.1 WYL domain-containing protein [Streptomyces sp. SID13588]